MGETMVKVMAGEIAGFGGPTGLTPAGI